LHSWKETAKKEVFTYVFILLTAFASAVSYCLFIVPNDFAPGGLSGIATMIQYKTGFSIGSFTLLANIPLCVFAYFAIERRFAIRSSVYVVAMSLFYNLLRDAAFLTPYYYDAGGVDTIFPCLLAGILCGAVYGINFSLSSSTGGIDFVSKYVNKKAPQFNFFWVSFAQNAIVAMLSYFVYTEDVDGFAMHNWKPVCLCLLYSFVANFIASRMIAGNLRATQFMIISEHTDAIKEEIFRTLHHSATEMEAVGAYSGENRRVLLCVVNSHQIVDFKKILKKYDKTFVLISPVQEIVGNFRRIK